MSNEEKKSPTSERLVSCSFCFRSFYESRLEGHSKICTKEKPFKPLSHHIINKKGSASISSMPLPVQNIKNSTKILTIPQFDEKEAFKEQTLIKCLKCDRKFSMDRIEKHKSICKGELIQKKCNSPIKLISDLKSFEENLNEIIHENEDKKEIEDFDYKQNDNLSNKNIILNEKSEKKIEIEKITSFKQLENNDLNPISNENYIKKQEISKNSLEIFKSFIKNQIKTNENEISIGKIDNPEEINPEISPKIDNLQLNFEKSEKNINSQTQSKSALLKGVNFSENTELKSFEIKELKENELSLKDSPRSHDELIDCPNCGRHFNPKSAQKHILYCKGNQKNKAKTPCSNIKSSEKQKKNDPKDQKHDLFSSTTNFLNKNIETPHKMQTRKSINLGNGQKLDPFVKDAKKRSFKTFKPFKLYDFNY